MYSIYINEFIRNNVVVTTEEKMYDIPANYPEDEMLLEPKVKNEMGKAGTFEFKMESSNPWYSSLLQMRTRFRVDYDGETIFFGRVLSISTTMYGTRTVHCEGALAFLLDTLMEGTKEDERNAVTLQTYVESLITSHNNLVENWKKFQIGQLPGHYSGVNDEQQPVGETKKFGTDSWTSIMNCLEDLTSKYGGYLRARYVNGQNYLDWLLNYYNPIPNNQPVEVGENVIDISNSVDVNGLFTVLIPEGSKQGKPLYLDTPPWRTVKSPVRKKKEEPEEPTEEGDASGS